MTTEEILHLNLTDEQYAAVIDDSRNILCLACAGSGKSRTLAYKIAYLISQGEEPESIIAFTFTEKAAESIKRRVAEALRKFGLSENIVGAMFIAGMVFEHIYTSNIGKKKSIPAEFFTSASRCA